MNKYTTLLISLLLSATTLEAEGRDKGFEFLNLPHSAQVAALGSTNVSFTSDEISIALENPGLLSPDKHHQQLSLNYTNYAADINMGSFIYGQFIGYRGAWAVGATYLDYGTFQERTAEDIFLGEFSARDLAIQGTYSYQLTNTIRAGVTAKLLYSGYERYSAWGLAADLGLSYVHPQGNFTAGLVFKNLGGEIKSFENENQSMPWDIQLGLSHKMRHAPFRFHLTAWQLNRWDMSIYRQKDSNSFGEELEEAKRDNFFLTMAKHLVFGIDFVPSDNFYISVGFNPKAQADFAIQNRKGVYGFSFGTGLRLKQFQIGMTYFQRNPGGGNFMLGVTTSFEKFKL